LARLGLEGRSARFIPRVRLTLLCKGEGSMFEDIFANAIKLIRPAERHEPTFFVVGGEPPCRRKEDHCTTAQVLHAGRLMTSSRLERK
jgi:hypothetical protein